MNFFKTASSAVALALLISTTANAGVINNFTGAYDVSNWSISVDGGSVDTSGAPYSILTVSSDTGSKDPSSTDVTITALGDGLVSFDWYFSTEDEDGPEFDPFGWLLNDIFTQLTDNDGETIQYGSTSFAVTTGDTFGFSAFATDSDLGASTTTISNFSAPASIASVPEPGSLALIAMGLFGLSISRKRKA